MKLVALLFSILASSCGYQLAGNGIVLKASIVDPETGATVSIETAK